MNAITIAKEEPGWVNLPPKSLPLHTNPPSDTANPSGGRVRPLKMPSGANERTFKLLKREKDVVLVEAISNTTHRRASLEVAIIKTRPPHPKDEDGANWDAVEFYPGNEMWGRLAWTWTHQEIAEAHFAFLVQYGRSGNFFGSEEYKSAKRRLRR